MRGQKRHLISVSLKNVIAYISASLVQSGSVTDVRQDKYMLFFKKKAVNSRTYTKKSPDAKVDRFARVREVKATKGLWQFLDHVRVLWRLCATHMVAVDWGRCRIHMVAVGFAVFWVVLWGRAWYWQVLEGSRLADQAKQQYMASVLITGKRGSIHDRHGQVLARSVECLSIYARPDEIDDVELTANTLGKILHIAPQKLHDQLSNDARKFVWLARKVDDYTVRAVKEARLTGIGFSKEYDRVYPFKEMAGQLMGFVGVDDQGLEGVERAFDEHLASVPTRQMIQRDAMGRRFYLYNEGQEEPSGKDLYLTIDTQVQFFAEEIIAKRVEDFDAKWGGVLVVDVLSGDILAWAQYPFFNPNAYKFYGPAQYRNRLASDALEPGSTLKPFLVAAALQEKIVKKDSVFDCEGGKWDVEGTSIRDTSWHNDLTVEEILRYSSNIGVAKIGQILGADMYHRYLSRLGFGERTVVPVAESKGILRSPSDWGAVDLLSTSFGQSLSVTALQMAQAYLTLVNGGVYKPLRLVVDEGILEEDREALKKKQGRIFSERVTKDILRMLRDVVEEDGSGHRARIAGIEVGGKTGTAQKADKAKGTYGEGRMASFVGFAPAENPRYLTLVIVDEPTVNPFGGVVAAPVFQQVTQLTMTYAGQLPDVVFAATADAPLIQRGAQLGENARGPKLSRNPVPLFTAASLEQPKRTANYHTLPGHLTKASALVPNVVGKTLRNAVELFARGGVVPVLKGQGQRVVRQSPAPGASWPSKDDVEYILWLSENEEKEDE